MPFFKYLCLLLSEMFSIFTYSISAWSVTQSREGNDTPLPYSCLENPVEGGVWWATVHGVAKSQTRLRDFTFTFIRIYTVADRTTYICAKLLQSYPTLWDPRDCSLQGTFVHGILQARILEWVAMPSPR